MGRAKVRGSRSEMIAQVRHQTQLLYCSKPASEQPREAGTKPIKVSVFNARSDGHRSGAMNAGSIHDCLGAGLGKSPKVAKEWWWSDQHDSAAGLVAQSSRRGRMGI